MKEGRKEGKLKWEDNNRHNWNIYTTHKKKMKHGTMKNDLFYSCGIAVCAFDSDKRYICNECILCIRMHCSDCAHAIQFNSCISRSTLVGVICLFVSSMLEFRKHFECISTIWYNFKNNCVKMSSFCKSEWHEYRKISTVLSVPTDQW